MDKKVDNEFIKKERRICYFKEKYRQYITINNYFFTNKLFFIKLIFYINILLLLFLMNDITLLHALYLIVCFCFKKSIMNKAIFKIAGYDIEDNPHIECHKNINLKIENIDCKFKRLCFFHSIMFNKAHIIVYSNHKQYTYISSFQLEKINEWCILCVSKCISYKSREQLQSLMMKNVFLIYINRK